MTDGARRQRLGQFAGIAFAAITALGYALIAYLAITDPQTPEAGGESPVAGALWLLSWVPFGIVGGILVAKRPRNPIGWQLSGISVPLMIVILLDVAIARAVNQGVNSGWMPWGAWVASWLFAPTVPLLGLLIASFPSGHIRSRLLSRLAPWAYATIPGIAMLRAIRPGPTDVAGLASPLALPLAREPVTLGIQVVTVVAVVYGLLAAVDLVVRYRRSRGVERRQLRWFAASVGFFAAMFGALLVSGEALTHVFGPVLGEIVATLVFTIGLGGMATAIGVGEVVGVAGEGVDCGDVVAQLQQRPTAVDNRPRNRRPRVGPLAQVPQALQRRVEERRVRVVVLRPVGEATERVCAALLERRAVHERERLGIEIGEQPASGSTVSVY